MNKVSITIDLSKIDKNRIVERTYQNKDGQTITCKDYKMDVVALKEKKILKAGDGWQLVKTHFVVNTQTKEEKANKEKNDTFLGDGIGFEDLNKSVEYPESEVTDVPF